MKKKWSLSLALSLIAAIMPHLALPANAVSQTYPPAPVTANVIAANAANYFAIKSDGSLWAWGENEKGQLGDGTTVSHYAPMKIMDSVLSVSAGANHTVAIKADGSLWAWGWNEQGQLGDGTSANRLAPVKILDSIVAVSAGYYHTAAIKTDGSLWVWGNNNEGSVGNGTWGSPILSPAKVLDGVAAVSADYGNTMAIRTDGSLWAWGRNLEGQLLDGTRTNHYTPTKMMDNVAAVSVGYTQVGVIKTDGSLWAWKWGWDWETRYPFWLDDGTSIDLANPYKVADGVVAASAKRHLTYIKTDGSLWQFGGAEDSYYDYVPTITYTKVSENVAATYASIYVKTDGSLWRWGDIYSNHSDLWFYVPISDPIWVMDGAMLPAVQRFSDVPASHWAYSAIMDMANKGVLRGYPDGTFKPGAHVTRSEFAVMMARALDMQLVSPSNPTFADVGQNDWDYAYVESAKKYLTGYRQGDKYYFKGREPAVREDMAVALVKAIKLENQQVDASELEDIFTDNSTVSPNLRKFVLIAYKNGLMNGYPDKTFGAQRTITRAEAASLLVRVLNSDAVKSTFG